MRTATARAGAAARAVHVALRRPGWTCRPDAGHPGEVGGVAPYGRDLPRPAARTESDGLVLCWTQAEDSRLQQRRLPCLQDVSARGRSGALSELAPRSSQGTIHFRPMRYNRRVVRHLRPDRPHRALAAVFAAVRYSRSSLTEREGRSKPLQARRLRPSRRSTLAHRDACGVLPRSSREPARETASMVGHHVLDRPRSFAPREWRSRRIGFGLNPPSWPRQNADAASIAGSSAAERRFRCGRSAAVTNLTVGGVPRRSAVAAGRAVHPLAPSRTESALARRRRTADGRSVNLMTDGFREGECREVDPVSRHASEKPGGGGVGRVPEATRATSRRRWRGRAGVAGERPREPSAPS